MSALYLCSRINCCAVRLHGQHPSYHHRVTQCGFNAPLTDYLWHGSFARAFLIVPVVMLLMGIGIWLFMPGHKGKEPDAIAV